MPDKFHAVHFRHVQIAQHDVHWLRLFPLQYLQRLLAIFGLQHILDTQRVQHMHHGLTLKVLVFSHQDAQCFHIHLLLDISNWGACSLLADECADNASKRLMVASGEMFNVLGAIRLYISAALYRTLGEYKDLSCRHPVRGPASIFQPGKLCNELLSACATVIAAMLLPCGKSGAIKRTLPVHGTVINALMAASMRPTVSSRVLSAAFRAPFRSPCLAACWMAVQIRSSSRA